MKTVKIKIDKNAHIEDLFWEINIQNNIPYVTISFKNLGYGVITAIKFSGIGFNTFGEPVSVNGDERFLLMIQDLQIAKNGFAKLPMISLPNANIRKLELEEWQVCYSNGDVLQYSGKDEIVIEAQEFDSDIEDEKTITALRKTVSEKIIYLPQETSSGWLCACGRLNENGTEVCTKCEMDKNEVFLIKNKDYLDNIVSEYENKQKQDFKKLKTRKRIISLIIIAGIILSVVLICVISYSVKMSKRKTFSSEEEMRNSLQGTYTYYSDSGSALRQIIISDDNLKIRYKYSSGISDSEYDIKEWDYSHGVIKTFREYVVTKKGDILDGNDLFKKGGYMLKSDLSDSDYSYESGSTALVITIDTVSSNSVSNYCTGTVKNTGKKTYSYVEVKGAFKDSSGEVIDTGWTYAVGSEGLAPGESSTFRISVDNNYRIKSCSVSLLDYDD